MIRRHRAPAIALLTAGVLGLVRSVVGIVLSTAMNIAFTAGADTTLLTTGSTVRGVVWTVTGVVIYALLAVAVFGWRGEKSAEDVDWDSQLPD